MLLRARILVPVNAPPIYDGGVHVHGGRIVAAGRWSDIQGDASGREIVDLGESVVLPGLVNAHAHLEYTGMAGRFTGADGFAHWVKSINEAKRTSSRDALAEQWLQGASMLVDSGTTTVADVQTVFGFAAARSTLSALTTIPFIEMTGVISRRAPEKILEEAETLLGELPGTGGFSPHSPYATLPGLLSLASRRAEEQHRLLTLHVAESLEEFEMFVHRRGALYEMIAALGRPMDDCDGRTPLAHVAGRGMLRRNTLLVHANYLTDEDLGLLAGSEASVVHCPGSHEFFGHEAFRYEELAGCGVNISLGTDSLATMRAEAGSTPELSMLEEMRRFSRKHPQTAPREILAMATINSARALTLEKQVGSLSIGNKADFIVLPYGGTEKDAEEAIVASELNVSASFIGGKQIKGLS